MPFLCDLYVRLKYKQNDVLILKIFQQEKILCCLANYKREWGKGCFSLELSVSALLSSRLMHRPACVL